MGGGGDKLSHGQVDTSPLTPRAGRVLYGQGLVHVGLASLC